MHFTIISFGAAVDNDFLQLSFIFDTDKSTWEFKGLLNFSLLKKQFGARPFCLVMIKKCKDTKCSLSYKDALIATLK